MVVVAVAAAVEEVDLGTVVAEVEVDLGTVVAEGVEALVGSNVI